MCCKGGECVCLKVRNLGMNELGPLHNLKKSDTIPEKSEGKKNEVLGL